MIKVGDLVELSGMKPGPAVGNRLLFLDDPGYVSHNMDRKSKFRTKKIFQGEVGVVVKLGSGSAEAVWILWGTSYGWMPTGWLQPHLTKIEEEDFDTYSV
jgi:hypothetical protein